MAELSIKVRNLSFCCALLIVLHHMNSVYVMKLVPWNMGLHDYVCNQLSFWAVRFFFVLSGFWFVRGHYASDGDWRCFYWGKVRTLLVPYFLFALAGMVMSAVFSPVYHWMVGKPLFYGTVFSSPDFLSAVNSTFGIVGHPEWNGSLWYVRALLMIFLFAPLLRWMSRHCIWVLMVLWLVLSNFHFDLLYASGLDIRPNQSCYFFLGMFIGKFGLERFKLRMPWSCLLIVVWLGLSLVPSLYIARGVEMTTGLQILQNLHFALAIPTAWVAYDLLPVQRLPVPEFAWGCSFFIYCAHGMVSAVLTSPIRFLLGKSTLASLVLTPCSWIVTVCGCLVVAKLLNQWCPQVYLLLVGGRSWSK